MVWDLCLNDLRTDMPEDEYALWIKPLIAQQKNDTLYILTPNAYFQRYIEEHYIEIIKTTTIRNAAGHIKDVMIVVDGGELQTRSVPATFVRDEPEAFMTIVLPSENISNKPYSTIRRTLNPLFTFDLFVEGKSNHMASQTCRRVVEALGDSSRNPLFLYGPTGLGKTHLMHAVGNQLLRENPKARVMYLTSEQFVGGYVGAIRKDTIDQFKREIRSLDLLLVDDIHLLAGRKASLEEFFYTFNALIDESKQIILTSDRYPKELTELDARLVSRFSWGLSVAVEPPDLLTRVGILLKKAEQSDIVLTENCAQFIAQHVMANVRELEGALNKVMATARFKATPIDIDLIKESLKDVIAIRARTISVDNIKKTVAEYFGVPIKELIGPKRTRMFARPRQIAMGLSRELTNQSFPEIGEAFGGRDHTTVMHAVEKVKLLCQTEANLAQDYQNLLRLLQH